MADISPSTTRPTTSVFVARDDSPIDQAQIKLRKALRDPLQTDTTAGDSIVAWVVSVFYLLISLLEALMKDAGDRSYNIEVDVEELQSKTTTSPVHNHPDPRKRKIRCDKCHASNHIAEYCRTTNPAAMRKRIATNQKKKKSARAVAAAATALPPFPSMPPPFPYYSNTFVPPDPQAIHTFMVDAQELRRRRQQSTRDKRRVRRSATS